MDGLAPQTITHTGLGDMLKDIGQQLSVGINNCAVDGTAEIIRAVLLQHHILLELHL